MYKIICMNEPGTVGPLLDLHVPSHGYLTRHVNYLIPPQLRVEAMRIGFLNQFIEVWNSVPQNIISESNSLKAFKKIFRAHLLQEY